MSTTTVINLVLLTPLAAAVTFYDVWYRRIPNKIVLLFLVTGLSKNIILAGWTGLFYGMAGCLLAFCLMLLLHFFGALGPGDVKLFASIGALIGWPLVAKTFLVVVISGGGIAAICMLYAGTVRVTMQKVAIILGGIFSEMKIARFDPPENRNQTIPYGVAICMGSLISQVIFQV